MAGVSEPAFGEGGAPGRYLLLGPRSADLDVGASVWVRSCCNCLRTARCTCLPMGAKKRARPPEKTGTTTFTLKFTTAERELVGRLLDARAKELREVTGQDMEVTIAGYLRWLIERDAQARGLKPSRK